MGETFVLGTSTWRITAIQPDRVLVESAAGSPALVPFWHGEASSRSNELGEEVGRLTRESTDRIDDPETVDWLKGECRLDDRARRR